MDATKSLVITLPEGTPDGTIIRYSLDCSNVTEQSPVYNGTPIEINANTIVRARLFHDDYLSPFTSTQSYIFHPRELKLPLISIVAQENDLYEINKGILAKPFCYQDYRRPINIEYFEPGVPNSCINQLCEMRTGGGWTSRNRPQNLSQKMWHTSKIGLKNACRSSMSISASSTAKVNRHQSESPILQLTRAPSI